MAGGIIQLVATGAQDIFLTSEPEITFFKITYRRHTNFSKTEFDLTFNNNLDFGTTSVLKIQRYGDLLHRLFLVIKLPKIDIVIENLTIYQVQVLLTGVNIVWVPNPPKPNSANFDEQDFVQVNTLITNEINNLQNQIASQYTPSLLDLGYNPDDPTVPVPGPLYPPVWKAATGNTEADFTIYMTDVLNDLFIYDQYQYEFLFIEAENSVKGTINDKSLNNSSNLLQQLFQIFSDYATSNSPNLLFIFYMNNAVYTVNSSIQSTTSAQMFLTGIDNAYANVPSSYDTLDSFKIFSAVVQQNSVVVGPGYNIPSELQILTSDIIFDLQNNILQVINIYNSFGDTAKFIFYRLFTVISGGYNTTSLWVNLSLQTITDPQLQDNFTSVFPVTTVLPGEPANLYFPMGNYVTSSVTNYHTANRNDFRASIFNDYFNQQNLWSPVDIIQSGLCPSETNPIFYNTNFFNLIPLVTNADIPDAINSNLDFQIQNTLNPVLKANIHNIKIAMQPLLTSENAAIQINLNNIIFNLVSQTTGENLSNDDFLTIQDVNTTYKTTQGVNGDIMDIAIIRQHEFINYNGVNRYLSDYVCQVYRDLLNNATLEGLPSYDDGSSTAVKPILVKVVELFRTPITSFPTFNVFVSQNFNLTNNPNIQINTQTSFFSDCISSIWWNLVSEFISNYNNLYNDNILSFFNFAEPFAPGTFDTLFGDEITSYVNNISVNYFDFTPFNPSPIPYYYFTSNFTVQCELPLNANNPLCPPNSGQIGTYLLNQLTTLQGQLTMFNENYGLLNMINIPLPNTTYYFEQYLVVLNYIIIDNIEVTTPTFIYYHTLTPDYVLYVYNYLVNQNPPLSDPFLYIFRFAAMDIVIQVITDWNNFLTSPTNPFNPVTQTALFNLYNTLMPNTWTPEQIETEGNKFTQLFGNINASTLYNDIVNINANYGGFQQESNVLDYMSNIILNASFLANVPPLIGTTVTGTNKNIVNYFIGQLNSDRQNISNLLSVQNILELSLEGGAPGTFAWIKYLGHYIINRIELYIGDQLVDTHNGEWLHLWHQLSKRRQKERGYNILIGNVPELYTYDKVTKDAYELIIPLKFWFCNNVGGSLPLVALKNTDVKLLVTLQGLNQVAYYDSFTRFVKVPKLNCKMFGEYIFLETEERNRLVKNKNEYLIEVLQNNGDTVINYSSLNQNNTLDLTLTAAEQQNVFTTKLYFNNPVKEMVWVFQNMNNINGVRTTDNPFGDMKYYNYAFDFVTESINPSSMAKIQFMSRDREAYKDIEYYNFIQPYKYHSSTPSVGINIYSMSMEPENFQQPKGAANMGKIDDSSVVTVVRNDVALSMQNNGTTFRFTIYGVSYQILRIMSGLAGVAFYY